MKKKKLTIQHYLNKELKKKEDGFSVYVRVVYDRKVSNFKSRVIQDRFFDEKKIPKSLIEAEKSVIRALVAECSIKNLHIKDIIAGYIKGQEVNKTSQTLKEPEIDYPYLIHKRLRAIENLLKQRNSWRRWA